MSSGTAPSDACSIRPVSFLPCGARIIPPAASTTTSVTIAVMTQPSENEKASSVCAPRWTSQIPRPSSNSAMTGNSGSIRCMTAPPGPQLLNGAKPRHDVDGRVHYPGHREGDDHNSDVNEQNDTEQGDLHLDPPPVQG